MMTSDIRHSDHFSRAKNPSAQCEAKAMSAQAEICVMRDSRASIPGSRLYANLNDVVLDVADFKKRRFAIALDGAGQDAATERRSCAFFSLSEKMNNRRGAVKGCLLHFRVGAQEVASSSLPSSAGSGCAVGLPTFSASMNFSREP